MFNVNYLKLQTPNLYGFLTEWATFKTVNGFDNDNFDVGSRTCMMLYYV